jgi:hypothetical protein
MSTKTKAYSQPKKKAITSMHEINTSLNLESVLEQGIKKNIRAYEKGSHGTEKI